MTDFALYHLNNWRDGQATPDLAAQHIVLVNYDQNTDAYEVSPPEFDDFIEWVSENWGGDNSGREISDDGDILETAKEHLNRIGCDVTRFRLREILENEQ